MLSRIVSIAVTWVRMIVQFAELMPGGQVGATRGERDVVPSSTTSARAGAAQAPVTPRATRRALYGRFMSPIQHDRGPTVASEGLAGAGLQARPMRNRGFALAAQRPEKAARPGPCSR